MADLVVGGRSLSGAQVVRLRPEAEAKALKGLGQDGLDNVVFALGADTFVASARDLGLQGLKARDVVAFQGQVGRVLQVDRHGGHTPTRKAALWGAVVGAVGMPLTYLGLGALFGSIGGMGLLGWAGMVGVGALAFAGLGAGLNAVNRWQAERWAKKANWAQHGQVVG